MGLDTVSPDAPKIVYGFIDREDPDVRILDDWDTIGMRASQSRTTVLDGAFAAPDRIVRRLDPGPNADPLIFGIFASFELLLAAVYAGIGARALELAVAAAHRRTSMKRDGAPLSQDPDIRWRIADAAITQDALEPQLLAIARDLDGLVDHGSHWFAKLVGVKVRSTETAKRVVDQAVRVSGGSHVLRGLGARPSSTATCWPASSTRPMTSRRTARWRTPGSVHSTPEPSSRLAHGICRAIGPRTRLATGGAAAPPRQPGGPRERRRFPHRDGTLRPRHVGLQHRPRTPGLRGHHVLRRHPLRVPRPRDPVQPARPSRRRLTGDAARTRHPRHLSRRRPQRHLAGPACRTAGDGRLAVITESTSFHPVDAAWPDQPADAGVIRSAAGEFPVRDAVVAATDGESLRLGADIPVRTGTEGWVFLVAHLVDEGSALAEGDEVEIEADAATRACPVGRAHRVPPRVARPQPRPRRPLVEAGPRRRARQPRLRRCRHRLIADPARRVGRPLPPQQVAAARAGFDTASVQGDLDDLRRSVAAQLDAWVATGATVRVERDGDGDGLTDRRSWVCELPDGTARIPCGGTHLTSLAELAAIEPSFTVVDDAGTPVLEMANEARRRH
jgi:Ser-tRNA(Ala) deacylase AlaX